MNNYIQLVKEQLRLHDPEGLEDALYAAYRELHPNDPEPISRDFPCWMRFCPSCRFRTATGCGT